MYLTSLPPPEKEKKKENKEDQSFCPATSILCAALEEANSFMAPLGTLFSLELLHSITLLYWFQLPSLSHRSQRVQDRDKAAVSTVWVPRHCSGPLEKEIINII